MAAAGLIGLIEGDVAIHIIFRFSFDHHGRAASTTATAFVQSVAGRAKTGQRGALKTGQCFDDAYSSSLRFRATFS
jgi:hypothetical protein